MFITRPTISMNIGQNRITWVQDVKSCFPKHYYRYIVQGQPFPINIYDVEDLICQFFRKLTWRCTACQSKAESFSLFRSNSAKNQFLNKHILWINISVNFFISSAYIVNNDLPFDVFKWNQEYFYSRLYWMKRNQARKAIVSWPSTALKLSTKW